MMLGNVPGHFLMSVGNRSMCPKGAEHLEQLPHLSPASIGAWEGSSSDSIIASKVLLNGRDGGRFALTCSMAIRQVAPIHLPRSSHTSALVE